MRNANLGKRRTLARAVLCLSVCLPCAPISAQAAPSSDVGDPGTIIVTALRQKEPLARTAAPVSVLSGKDALESGAIYADRLNDRFPSLTVQPSATGNLIFIRGVGNFTLQPNSDPAIAYVYDGVFIGRPIGTLSQLFDLDRIEVLKGPQGVLYGRNASGGSINIEPRQPVLGERSVTANVSLTTDGETHDEAAINLPIGPTTALRIAGALSDEPAILKGYRGGPEQQSIRAQVKTRSGDVTTVRLSADYNHIGGVGMGTSYVGNYAFDRATGAYDFVPSGLPLSEGIYSPRSQAYRQTIFLRSAGRNLDAITSKPRQDNQFYGAHARIDSDLGIGQLTIIPAWRRATIDAIVSGSPFGYLQRDRNEQASLETRLAGSRGAVDWLAGSLLFDENVDSHTVTNLSSLLTRSRQHYRTLSGALFGNLTIHVAPRFRLTSGVRVTEDHKTYSSNGDTLVMGCVRVVGKVPSCPDVPLFPLVDNFADVPFDIPDQPGAVQPILIDGAPTGAVVQRTVSAATGRLTNRALTWRAGGELDAGPRSLFYATVETGYRPGGFNTAVGYETYRPEWVTSYTLGFRHRSANARLQLDVEAFWWNYRDQQVSSLRPDLGTPPKNANITDNIASSRIRGIEADVRVRPWTGMQMRAVIQYLDADYRAFSYFYANNGSPGAPVPPLTGCPVALAATTNLYTVDCSAKQPYNSPRWSISPSLRQSVRIGAVTLTGVVDTNYRSARNIGFAFLPQQRIGPTWTSNAQVIVALPGGRTEIAAFVRNIEGTRIPQFMIYHPISNALVAATSMPRQVGIRASMRF